VSYKKQELRALCEHLTSPPDFGGVRVALHFSFLLSYYVSLRSEFRVVLSYYVSLRSEFRVVLYIYMSYIDHGFVLYVEVLNIHQLDIFYLC
jgi:hypothetical protein